MPHGLEHGLKCCILNDRPRSELCKLEIPLMGDQMNLRKQHRNFSVCLFGQCKQYLFGPGIMLAMPLLCLS